jgi:hypothetical protein
MDLFLFPILETTTSVMKSRPLFRIKGILLVDFARYLEIRSLGLLLGTANVTITVTLIRVELRSSETSVLTRATRRHVLKDGILHINRRVILKSYITQLYDHLLVSSVDVKKTWICMSISPYSFMEWCLIC